MPETLQQSLVDIASDLRSGKVTATALAEEANANNQSRGPVLGAYKTRDPERFLAEARAADAAFAAGLDFGPLQGIPVCVKDLYGVSGYPTFAGTPLHCRKNGQLKARWSAPFANRLPRSRARHTPLSLPSAGWEPTPIGEPRAIHGMIRDTASQAVPVPGPGSACVSNQPLSRWVAIQPAPFAYQPASPALSV